MSKEQTSQHKEFLKEEKKKDKEQAKERHTNKKGKHIISPVIR